MTGPNPIFLNIFCQVFCQTFVDIGSPIEPGRISVL